MAYGTSGIQTHEQWLGLVQPVGLVVAPAVLTKLDGTAKGGIIFPLFDRLGIPVKFVGTGEGVDDIEPFDRDMYIDALFGSPDQ